MGATYVNVMVSNPAEPHRQWEGEFLADTGASHSIVPRRRLEAVGVAPRGRRMFEMADGSLIEFDLGSAILSFMGEDSPSAVLFGADDAEPVLGLITMQEVGVKVDPVNHCIERSKLRI